MISARLTQHDGAHPMRESQRWAAAFTLIEVLAVVTLLSMIAGVGVLSLSAAHGRAQLDATVGRLQQLDGRARLAAQTSGTMQMVHDESANAVRLAAAAANEIIARHTLGANTNLTLTLIDPANEQESQTSMIPFDRTGRSPDYEVAVTNELTTRRWRSCGLTGWLIELDTDGGATP